MERVVFNGVVQTDYGQLDLLWAPEGGFDGAFERFFAGQVNGLVGAADPSGVYLVLARRSGGSRVRIILVDTEPPLPAPRFEDVVEVSTMVPEGARPRWVSWAGETWGDLPGLTSGAYRLRVSAHGRDAGHQGEFEDGVVDDYLVELWPSGPAQDQILRVGSDDARYWHAEIGNRR